MKLTGYISIVLFSLLSIIGCKNDPKVDNRDTPTSGKIHIVVDETYKTLIDSEITVFKSVYNNADITVDYVPEAYAVQQLLADSARAIVIGRQLNPKELEQYKARKYEPKTVRVATDAIAVIVHPKNETDELFIDQLKNILTGATPKWSNGKDIQIVLDNPGSGTLSFLRDSVLKGSALGKNVYAMKNTKEILEYVASHENAISFVGVNLITSFDGDANQLFLNTIKPLGIAKNATDRSYKPYQAYVAARQYPFLRFTNLIVDEAYNGLGSGFATFVASDQGQRIILKDGLVPSNSPIRLIEVNTSNNPLNSN